jgi:hypothetical protein
MPGNSKKTICVKTIFKKNILVALMLVFACFLCSCNPVDNTVVTTINKSIEGDSGYHPLTDEEGVYVGQDKEVPGYYKRIGIAKIGGTYEDMLELQDIEKQGYLVANDDGTAFFELDGKKTEFVFDKAYFYLSDDAKKTNGFHYTCINGRLIINDGTTITQYLRLTDEELSSYLKSNKTGTVQ